MKKKVLHISAGGLGSGGVSTVIFSIVKNLHTQFDFSCVVFNRKLEREVLFEYYGRLHRINCYPEKRSVIEKFLRPFRLYCGIKRLCKTHHYDIVHCHNYYDAWICLLAAKHAAIPMRIAHSHNTKSPHKKTLPTKLYNMLNAYMTCRSSTHNIGCSAAACKDFFKDNKFSVIYNSIDFSANNYLQNEKERNYTFIHVGRYCYQKNQCFIIDTFAHIATQLPGAVLYLVGFGNEEETTLLKQHIHKTGMDTKIKLIPGNIIDVFSLYSQATYMIFPSRYEGFGIVLLEAQAMGIQCYVSENIQPEVDAGMLTFLNLSDGPKKWAEYILEDIRNGVRKTCDPTLLSQFDEKVICQRYAELYMGE